MDDRRPNPAAAPLRDAEADARSAGEGPRTAQTAHPAYRLAFSDEDFLLGPAARPIRLQLELMKTELALTEAGVESTVVLFGGARIREGDGADLSPFYDEARRFARLVTERSLAAGGARDVIVTGGGPGVMEAGNRGAAEAGGRSVGLNVVLPHEQAPNGYVTPELSFRFHYFAVRKLHFLLRAGAVCVFPGGFGTLDELFETLTLIQTGRMSKIPVLLFGKPFWDRVVNFEALVEAGTIAHADLDLFRFVETADEAIEAIETWPDPFEKRDDVPGRSDGTP